MDSALTGTMAPTDMATGTNESERYLARLCRHSFLRLWSYSNVYRNQSWGTTEGKELCDLLVVFDRHVILFSDKHCAFPASGDLKINWARWFRRAIQASADQLLGAERWLRHHPDRVFLDAKCSRPLQVPLPRLDEMIVHRVAVAHGASEACRRHLGGSGSLVLSSDVIGEQHHKPSDSAEPFVVGRTHPKPHGFVHIVDDTTLDVLLRTLDTVADFVDYLSARELLLDSQSTIRALGEENLLARYLTHLDEDGKHHFNLPEHGTVLVDDGFWSDFCSHPDRLAQIEANRPSYAWDALVEKFSKHAIEGTLEFGAERPISDHEEGLRHLARPNRVRRRMLATALLGIIERGNDRDRAARIIEPSDPSEPYFLFLSLRQPSFASRSDYREARRNLLYYYALALKLKYPSAQTIVGIASDPASAGVDRSEDLLHFDARKWSPELELEARQVQADLGLLESGRRLRSHDNEYPLERNRRFRKGRSRNLACPCGSGRKYKKCHGARF